MRLNREETKKNEGDYAKKINENEEGEKA